jgi:hypothetical protein
MQTTDWFSADQKPARFGIYEVLQTKRPNQRLFCFWDGVRWRRGWYLEAGDTLTKPGPNNPVSRNQRRIWRGLIK